MHWFLICDVMQVSNLKPRSQSEDAQDPEKKPRSLPFPLVDYDPAKSYLNLLKACYGHVAKFYYGSEGSVIGVKLDQSVLEQEMFATGLVQNPGKRLRLGTTKEELHYDLESLVEDFEVLGKGLVKEVMCQFSD